MFIKLIKLIKGYDCVFPFHKGYAQVRKHGKWGIINRFGKQICDVKYDFYYIHYYMNPSLIEVYLNGMYGLIDLSGKEICEIKYDSIGIFRATGFSKATMNGIMGIIHISNPNEFIPFELVSHGTGDGNDIYYARHKDIYVLAINGNVGTLEEFEEAAVNSDDDIIHK